MGHHTDLPRELGDGLILRWARPGDGSELADFNGAMHSGEDYPAAPLRDWTRDLFDTPHPTFQPDRDVTVVEDTSTGRIVSALFLIPQVWSYAGVPMKTGQPELVGTHPDYRRRGLIRAQFDVIHEVGRAAGQLWQFISGIPWYYHQFGYSYTLDMPPRPMLLFDNTSPDNRPGLTVRTATAADVAFMAATEAEAASGTALGALRGVDGFTLELARRPGSIVGCEVLVIEADSDGGTPLGYAAFNRRVIKGLVSLYAFELRRGAGWIAPTAAVVAHVQQWAQRRPDHACHGIRFALPDGHPALRCVSTQLAVRSFGTYALYVRVPDVVVFLEAVAAVLETRLASSPAGAWTGELRLDLYERALRLRFEEGRVAGVEASAAEPGGAVDARLPPTDFLHLLLGNRSIAELDRTSAACILETDMGALLLDVLFPPMPMSRWEFC